MMKRSNLALLFIFLLCCLPLVFAQNSNQSQGKASDTGKGKDKEYALIYGSVFAPNGTLAKGVRVLIRKSDSKKPKYERFSDSQGEFAQRVPVGPADYIVYADPKSPPFGKHSKIKPGKEVTVHIAKDERQDISLHLTE
jgi:hypothetical protein